MRPAILRSGILLALATLGTSAATAQTELYFATGVDSTGWAEAQSNADGHVLIESPQYPRGLWLHLVDEAGDALAGIRVEYQGRPDSLVAIHCVDPTGGVRETLVWTRPSGDPLRLTLKPRETADLPVGIALIDWQIDPTTRSLLEPVAKDQSIGWPDLTAFLREHWQEKTGRVVVQIDTRAVLAVDLDHLESIERLVNYLQDQATTVRGAINTSTLQVLLNARAFKSALALPESVVILSTFFVLLFEDPNIEEWVLGALGRRKGPITLAQAASLTELSISDSSFHSLAGIENLVALEALYIEKCDVTDVRPLAALTNLGLLRLDYNRIVDVGPLAALTNLETLTLWDNQITDVNPLAALTNLTWLALGGNQIADVRPLAALTNLEWLILSDNQITTVRPLTTLTELKGLWLAYNQITAVRPLAALTNLFVLDLIYNHIADVRPLAALTNLAVLQLDYNRIADVGPLAALTKLETLTLWDNQITDVSPLATLTNLTWLALGGNQIADVSPLATLTKLESLILGGNQIADVSPLATLTKLTWLDLNDNQIEDLAPLVANPGLGEGTLVGLQNNPLSDQALTEHIPALQARGVTVRY